MLHGVLRGAQLSHGVEQLQGAELVNSFGWNGTFPRGGHQELDGVLRRGDAGLRNGSDDGLFDGARLLRSSHCLWQLSGDGRRRLEGVQRLKRCERFRGRN